MKFPHAAKGVKKIFTAQILSLIASLSSGIITVLLITLGVSANAENDLGASISLIGMMVVGAAALVLLIVGGILNIVGYIQAAIDESGFRKAIICTVFSIIFGTAYYFLQPMSGFWGWLGAGCSAASQIAQMLVTLFAISGLMNLSAQCDRPDMVHKGTNILKVITAMYILSLLVIIMTRLFWQNDFNNAIATVLSIVIVVLSLIEYILYLSYLGKCSKMLKEN